MYYQGRDGGKPPSLHYTPLKQEGSKTLTDFTDEAIVHYTPLKHEGSKTEIFSYFLNASHYTPLKHETPPENAKKAPVRTNLCGQGLFLFPL